MRSLERENEGEWARVNRLCGPCTQVVPSMYTEPDVSHVATGNVPVVVIALEANRCGSSLRIEVSETITYHFEQYGLPTPPPSPMPNEPFISQTDVAP